MVGLTHLETLLATLSPALIQGEFVYCCVTGEYADYAHLMPVGSFLEEEGLTLILPVESARQANLDFEVRFRQISLLVHSSLEAVGLTAAISAKLAEVDISANIVAGYYHDHVFVPSHKAEHAMQALNELSK